MQFLGYSRRYAFDPIHRSHPLISTRTLRITRRLKLSSGIVQKLMDGKVQWDVWDRWWNHSDVVRELEARGLRSLYHHHQSLPQGGEPHPTFFLHRKPEKPYHIDYVFAAQAWRIEGLEIGAADEWLALSDHMPILAAVGK